MPTFSSTVTSNAATTNSVATSQTPAGAGNLTLVSSSVTFGSASAQYLTVTSTADISNRTFTFTGTNVYGNSATVTLTGPNNNTVTSTLALMTVTNVAISGAAAGAITVGNSAYAEGVMFVADMESNPFSIGFAGILASGSPTYTVQQTYDDVLAKTYSYSSTSNTWFNHATVAAKTTNFEGTYTAPVRGIKLTLSAAGAVTLKLLQTGAGYR